MAAEQLELGLAPRPVAKRTRKRVAGPRDFAGELAAPRGRLLTLLWDLQWHEHAELEVAGNRYTARLLELRRRGYSIESRELAIGKAYRLVSREPGEPQARQVRVYLSPGDAETVVAGYPSRAAQTAHAAALASFKARTGCL